MKSTRLASLITLVFSTIFGASVLLAPPVGAAELQCAVLPSKFCQAATQAPSERSTSKNSAVFMVLEWVLGIMTAGVGVAAIAAFVYAGIMYSSADGRAEQVKKAKDIMLQTVIGLVAFAIMALALQYLIPGGVF